MQKQPVQSRGDLLLVDRKALKSCSERGVPLQCLFDFVCGNMIGLTVQVSGELFVAEFVLVTRPARLSSCFSFFTNFARAAERRFMTVPIGMSKMPAASL